MAFTVDDRITGVEVLDGGEIRQKLNDILPLDDRVTPVEISGRDEIRQKLEEIFPRTDVDLTDKDSLDRGE